MSRDIVRGPPLCSLNREFTLDSGIYVTRREMDMNFPRRDGRRMKARPKAVELPSLLATISARQATTPTARIQAKTASSNFTDAETETGSDAILAGNSTRDSACSPSFNRSAATLLTGRK